MKKLQVYALYKGDYLSETGIIEFPSDLEMERKIGGTVESVPINDKLILIRGVEYNLLKVPVNRLWFKSNKLYGVLYGDAFIARVDADNNYASVLDSDIEFIEKSFRPVILHIPDRQYTYLTEDLNLADWKIE